MSEDHLQQLMMLAGLGLLCWLMLRGKMRRRRIQSSPTFSVGHNSLGHNSNAKSTAAGFTGTKSLGAPADVLRWQVELHDLGRELKAELDSKLVAVGAMTKSYDQAARRLADMIRLAEQVQRPVASPLTETRRLAELGWKPAKIAAVLDLSESEIEQLLG